jgi:hypothetical protein
MRRPSFIRTLCILSGVPLVLLLYKRHLDHISRSISKDLDWLLNRRTLEARQRCEKLLLGIEGCREIAGKAIATPAQPEHLQRALYEISDVLGRALTS